MIAYLKPVKVSEVVFLCFKSCYNHAKAVIENFSKCKE